MSFLVYITSLIAFMILIIIDKMHNFILKPEGRYNIRLVSVINTYLNKLLFYPKIYFQCTLKYLYNYINR